MLSNCSILIQIIILDNIVLISYIINDILRLASKVDTQFPALDLATLTKRCLNHQLILAHVSQTFSFFCSRFYPIEPNGYFRVCCNECGQCTRRLTQHL